MINKIITSLVGITLIFGAIVFGVNYDPPVEFGAPFRPSGIDISIREDLAAGVSRTGNTLIVDPIITKSGHRVTMADIGSIAFGKLNPNLDNEEIISWTGMTDNTSTYTLTGVDWGYNFHNSATSTANIKRHFSGSRFIITNDDHWLRAQFAALDVNNIFTQDNTFSGVQTFNLYPEVAAGLGNATTSRQLITLGQFAAGLAQGAATSTEAFGGIVRLGTAAEQGAGYDGGSDDPTVLQTKNATSTPSSNPTLRALKTVIANASGYISQTWLNLTEQWNFTGGATFNTATSTRMVVGSTNPTTNDDLWVGGNAYISGNATTTGAFHFNELIDSNNISVTSIGQPTHATSTAERLLMQDGLDIVSFEIPAGKLGSSSGVRIKANIQYTYPNDTSDITFGYLLKFGGSTIATCTFSGGSYQSAAIQIFCEGVVMNRTTNSQIYMGTRDVKTPNTPFRSITMTEGELSVDTTAAVTVEVEQSFSTSANNPTINRTNAIVEYIWD